MGLIKSPNLTSDYILSQVDEASIFSAYFGEFELGSVYPSVFRKDDNPSTGFYISSSGKLIYNDLATSEKLDCFSFVSKKFNLSYGKALLKIACDFGLIKCDGVVPFSLSDLSKSRLVSEKVRKSTVIKIVPDKWSPAYLKFWHEFFISETELEENKVYPVKKLIINDTTIPNFSKNVRYALTLNHEGEVFKKIYNPYAENKKFKWISNIPIYLPFGFDSLPYISESLVITKSQKDRIIFKKYFSDVIGLQNESPASLREKTIAYLKNRYKKIYINCDLDKAGQDAVEYFKNQGFIPMMLPDLVYEKYDIKDVSDFVKRFGIKRFEDFLRHNNHV